MRELVAGGLMIIGVLIAVVGAVGLDDRNAPSLMAGGAVNAAITRRTLEQLRKSV